jgi:hypothetical protein
MCPLQGLFIFTKIAFMTAIQTYNHFIPLGWHFKRNKGSKANVTVNKWKVKVSFKVTGKFCYAYCLILYNM